MRLSRAVSALAFGLISLALLASTGASASWLTCAMSEQVMPNGARCACVHETHDSAVPTLERLPCCTSVEIARTEVPPSSLTVHAPVSAPLLLELAPVTLARAPLVLARVDARVPALARVSTGPPIPIRLQHLLI